MLVASNITITVHRANRDAVAQFCEDNGCAVYHAPGQHNNFVDLTLMVCSNEIAAVADLLKHVAARWQ